jgi:hypothetical protein
LYARAAGSQDTFIVSVSHQYNTILILILMCTTRHVAHSVQL